MAIPEDVRAQLASPDEEQRHSGVQALREWGAEALPLLAEALGDRSWRVRKASLEVLVALPGEEKIRPLLQGLRHEDNAGLRNTCMEALIRLGREAVPALAALSRDPDADLRKFVVDTLGNVEDAAAAAELLAALEDPDENVSAAAAEYLGRRRRREAVPALRRCLSRGGAWLTFSCLRALGEIGDGAAVPDILPLVRESGMRKAALEALGRVGGEETVPFLIDGLFSGERGLRRTAVLAAVRVLQRLEARGADTTALREGVARRADRQFVEFLRELLGQEDPEARGAAAVLLGFAPGDEPVGILLEAMARAPEPEQELYVRVLRGMSAQNLPLLLPRLQDPAPAVRLRVAQVLGDRRAHEAVPGLLPLLEDGVGHVRSAAARALGEIGDAVAVAPLAGLLRDPYPDVREAGREALVALGSPDAPRAEFVLSLLAPHLSSAEEVVAAAVIRIVGRLGGSEHVPRLSYALKDARSAVRRAAVEALGTIRAPEAVESLRVALTDEDVSVRREAVQRLGQLGGPAVLPLLLPMLQDEDMWVRVRTVQALAAVDHPEAHHVLVAAAREDAPGPKKLAAIRALGQGRVREACPVLVGLAASPERETRLAAVEALGLLGEVAAVEVLTGRLEDADWGLRAAAAKALAPFAAAGPVRAALEKTAAGDADPLVRRVATDALSGRPGTPGR